MWHGGCEGSRTMGEQLAVVFAGSLAIFVIILMLVDHNDRMN